MPTWKQHLSYYGYIRLSTVTILICLMLLYLSSPGALARTTGEKAARTFIQNSYHQLLVGWNDTDSFPTEEFQRRREKMFNRLGDNVGIVWGASVPAAPVKFRQSPDLYYLTGIEEPDAILVMVGKDKKSFIVAQKPSDNDVRWIGPGIWQETNFQEKYGIDHLLSSEHFWPMLSYLTKQSATLYLPLTPRDRVHESRDEVNYFEMKATNHPINDGVPRWKQAITKIREMLPAVDLADIHPFIDELRWIKSPYEIEQLKVAGRIGAEGVLQAIKNTQPGRYEYELEAEAAYYYTKQGARGVAFAPIVASGPNTYTVHYSQNNRQMQEGDIVMMDYGCDYNYYTSDITRVWSVAGEFSPKEEKMYRCILEARDSIIAAMRPGVTLNKLKEISHEIYQRHGYEDKELSWNSYIGHFVGLSVHDATPFDEDTSLEAGVVFNVEPVLDDPEAKIHMRLEDTVLITEEGALNLTSQVPARLEEIYQLVNDASFQPSSQNTN